MLAAAASFVVAKDGERFPFDFFSFIVSAPCLACGPSFA
jgi:hypothetical protein